MQTLKIIPERDVYRLIMRSKLPAAERFEEWVVGEVLPSIRKTGKYAVADQAVKAPTSMKEALKMALHLVEQREALEQKIQEDAPKVAFHDRVAKPLDTYTVAEAAKLLGTGRNKLFEFLRFKGWVQKHNEPYQSKITLGLMNLKLHTYEHPNTGEKMHKVTPLITGKGIARLRQLWDAERGVAA